MPHPDAQNIPQAHEPQDRDVTSCDPQCDQLFPLAPSPDVPADDDPEDDPDEIFRRAVSEMKTQPLPRSMEEALARKRLAICLLILVGSFLAGSIVGVLTYPTVTITLFPAEQERTLTVSITMPVRYLAPVTLTQSLSAPTTGRGHQDARAASGTLTFYNGEFTAQTLAAGTVFTANDGIEVATEAEATVPAANPPYLGQASVIARAVMVGANGNINALDINARCCFPDMVVKNSLPFSGGRDARDYQAVAQLDLSTLTARLTHRLALLIPQAFALKPGEAVQPTRCASRFSANHQEGEEAQGVTVTGVETCQGLAYVAADVSRQVIVTFTTRANPGSQYELIGAVQTTVVSVSPFLVRCRGTWVYHLSGEEERFLAAHIAGDNPQQATTYLLQTGFVRQTVVPENVPKDPDHVHFRVMVDS